jgi:uncharacterized damage-inducible protein DinB
MTRILPPQANEYAPFYANYVQLANQRGDVITTLYELKDSTYTLFTGLSDKADHAYAPGKWTIKQMLAHMIDTERVFAYRLLCFMRKDATPLPGFDENEYAENNEVSTRSLTDLADEFRTLRTANLYLYRSVTEEASVHLGNANGHAMSVRAQLHVIAGHELHHLNILHERYL